MLCLRRCNGGRRLRRSELSGSASGGLPVLTPGEGIQPVQKSSPKSRSFFGTALRQFVESDMPFLVGGGYAMKRHTGLARPARDLDLFVLPEDVDRVLRHFAALDYRV